jgi:pantoate--beta-alanine ligase
MKHVTTLAQARALTAASPRPLGLVPTMGALHAGHLDLLRRARRRCASVVVSIFVNPLQFAPNEDFERYPRDHEGDRAKVAGSGADILFIPGDAEMYPEDFTTYVDVGRLGNAFEGAQRPTHFRGVTTVIAKLLNIVAPDVLFLGQKDAQQAAVIRKMIRDLNFAVEIDLTPTVREPDGLAMSSRNRYLDGEMRAQAATLHRALETTKDALEKGRSKRDAIDAGAAALSKSASLDYLDVVDAETFEPLERLRPPAFIVAAARFGTTRLIDNLWIAS